VARLPTPNQPPVSRCGDIWTLAKHRIACGNSLEEASYQQVLGDKRASAVFTDPPFNVRVQGHATCNGAIRHREFAMASGEMTEEAFLGFLDRFIKMLTQHTVAGSVHFICMDWRNLDSLLTTAKEHYDALLNLCVWVKDNGGMGSLYRSQHELVVVARNGQERHRNNVQLGRFGRNRTNVWQYPGISTMSKQREEGNLLALHPTVKPIAMVVTPRHCFGSQPWRARDHGLRPRVGSFPVPSQPGQRPCTSH
jgi:DNA methylase